MITPPREGPAEEKKCPWAPKAKRRRTTETETRRELDFSSSSTDNAIQDGQNAIQDGQNQPVPPVLAAGLQEHGHAIGQALAAEQEQQHNDPADDEQPQSRPPSP